MQQRIRPNLWFDTEAEEAAEFYVSIFDNSRVVNVTRYTDAGPREAGMVMTVEFELDGQRFVGINGGPEFTFDEAMSLEIVCEGQEEVDYYWERLTDGGVGVAVRLAQGPLRRLLAGGAQGHGRGVLRSRPGARQAGDGGDAQDAQARHRRAAGGGRRRHRGLT
jgi:predicted 3-demethylubiquinone-9 3-methyltransferase (glyoxalase superfamily)